jgi:hypothetical protein
VLPCEGKLWHQTRKLVGHDLYHEGDVLPGHVLGSYQKVTMKAIKNVLTPFGS